MAPKSRRKSHLITDRLASEPGRFSFFQAVRILQAFVRPKNSKEKELGPVGYDVTPDNEVVHFYSTPRLSYPGTEVTGINYKKKKTTHKSESRNSIPNLIVSFLGLTGPKGVLPTHYTELLQQRQREKDEGIRDFLNLLNHRTISLFYRAWQKHRLPISYELHHQYPQLGKTDSITNLLHALVGNSDENVRKELPVDAETILYYAGQFSSSRRSAPSLDLLLEACFKVPVMTKQFVGEWVDLNDDDCIQFPSATHKRGQNNQLGVNAILGNRAYIYESKFQLELGPLSKQQFNSIKPGSERFNSMCKLTQLFAGADMNFNVRMKVAPDAISKIKLDNKQANASQLGWDTWLLTDRGIKDNTGTSQEIVVPAAC